MEPHLQTIAQLIAELKTNLQTGLSKKEVETLRATYGPNSLPEHLPKSWIAIFFSQFKSPLIYILMLAAVIIYFVESEKKDAYIISIVLLFNAIIGTIQEGRARNIMLSLKRFIKSECFVIRDGKKLLVEDEELVPGDLILLQEGQRVPADARVIESNNLQIDQAMLTGESEPVFKTTEIVADESPVAERTNMIYKGTYILAGSGKAIVTTTGSATQIGTIQKITQDVEEEMPLKREIDRLSRWIIFFIFVLCLFLFSVGFITGKPLQELLVMLTALFVCVIPEGLPIALTLVLTRGAYQMAQQNMLVKRMQAVEGLGRTDVILVDKTGTLTRNELVVVKAGVEGILFDVTGSGYHAKGGLLRDGVIVKFPQEDQNLVTMGYAAALLNSSEIHLDAATNLFSIKGDPTEAAMFVFAQKLGLTKEQLEKEYKKLYEIPFDSRYKYHAAFFQKGTQGIAFIIGSPEVFVRASATISPGMNAQFQAMLQEGLRVVAVGVREFTLGQIPGEESEHLSFYQRLVQQDLTILGFFGIQDSIRPDVPALIEQARKAGLRVIMVTGDHEKTALYVAKLVGIFRSGDRAIEGPELDHLSDEELARIMDSVTVYSRTTPEQKQRIIKMFHKFGKIVAMTGDGINDVPSIVAADLGIAMGRIGTEVAKEAADLILLDDSFSSIIQGIEQGRYIFYTLRRVILYFFATNMGELLIVLFALVLDFPLPLTAAQILWLNLVTDGFLDIAIAVEPKEKGLLLSSWLKRKPKLFDASMAAKMLWMAVPMAAGSMWVFYSYYHQDVRLARTMTLLSMAMFQWFNAWNCRSETKSVLQLGLFTNLWLVAATFFVGFLQWLLIYTPWLQTMFDTVPITLDDWGYVTGVAFSIVIVEEMRKLYVRRKYARLH